MTRQSKILTKEVIRNRLRETRAELKLVKQDLQALKKTARQAKAEVRGRMQAQKVADRGVLRQLKSIEKLTDTIESLKAT